MHLFLMTGSVHSSNQNARVLMRNCLIYPHFMKPPAAKKLLWLHSRKICAELYRSNQDLRTTPSTCSAYSTTLASPLILPHLIEVPLFTCKIYHKYHQVITSDFRLFLGSSTKIWKSLSPIIYVITHLSF